MNVLITGGAGFIGSNLSRKLIGLGHNVTILDNLSPQIHGDNPRINSALYKSIAKEARFILGDVTKREDWIEAIHGQNAIIHLAAETGTGQSMYSIHKYINVNVQGTSLMLDILANSSHTIEKVLVASSRSIYGEGKYLHPTYGVVYPTQRDEINMLNRNFEPFYIDEEPLKLCATDEESKIHPSSVYGITKQNQEQMVLTVCKSLGISAIAFRYQNVYGPGQSLKNPYTGILSIFSTQIRNGNTINIFEDGLESRDFVFIDDVVDATVLGLESNHIKNNALNVGSGVPTTVLDVAKTLTSKYKIDVPIKITGQFRLGDIRHNYADLNNISKQLGFTPKVDFQKGVEQFCNWVLTQEIEKDFLEHSLREMKDKGLFK